MRVSQLPECACASVCHVPFHAVNMNGCNAVVRCFALSMCAFRMRMRIRMISVSFGSCMCVRVRARACVCWFSFFMDIGDVLVHGIHSTCLPSNKNPLRICQNNQCACKKFVLLASVYLHYLCFVGIFFLFQINILLLQQFLVFLFWPITLFVARSILTFVIWNM